MMNKCCLNLFERVLEQVKLDLKAQLVWDVALLFEGKALIKREYILADFRIVENLRRKSSSSLFFLNKKVASGTVYDLRAIVEKSITRAGQTGVRAIFKAERIG